MRIRQITGNKKKYLPLLLIGDEQESMIDRYLNCGDMFGMFNGEEIIAEIVITNEGGGTYEIKNIAVASGYRKKGYARRMVNFTEQFYTPYLFRLKAGTAETVEMDTFYRHLGFEAKGRIENFFTDNYDHPIIECGIYLKDMIYYEKDFPHHINYSQHLSRRLHSHDIIGLYHLALNDVKLHHLLFQLIGNENKRAATNAAWVFSRLSEKVQDIFTGQQLQQLQNIAAETKNDTLCRLLLTIILNVSKSSRNTLSDGLFLEFCLHNISNSQRPSGIRVLCLKLAYEISRNYTEIQEELQQTIALIESGPLSPSLTSACTNILKAMQKNKT